MVLSQLANQSINQPATKQSINQSNNQSINQSINWTIYGHCAIAERKCIYYVYFVIVVAYLRQWTLARQNGSTLLNISRSFVESGNIVGPRALDVWFHEAELKHSRLVDWEKSLQKAGTWELECCVEIRSKGERTLWNFKISKIDSYMSMQQKRYHGWLCIVWSLCRLWFSFLGIRSIGWFIWNEGWFFSENKIWQKTHAIVTNDSKFEFKHYCARAVSSQYTMHCAVRTAHCTTTYPLPLASPHYRSLDWLID